MSSFSRRGIQSALILVIVALGVPRAGAVEPAREFLDALRGRGYYDVALDYLNTIEGNPSVPVAFKEMLQFERGLTLVQGAKHQRDIGIREKWLNDGQQVLNQFVTTQGNSPLVNSARSQLGNLLVERARLKMKKSERQVGEEKTKLFTEARGMYTEGKVVFEKLVDELREKLKLYPAAITDKSDPKKYEEREQLRRDFLQAQLLVAATVEELAETYPKGPEQAKAYTDAAEGYKKIYEMYRTRLAGLYARLYQARCNQKLGKHKEAIGYFTELLANPDTPDAFHSLRAKTVELALDSWLAEKLHKEAIEKAYPLINEARANEDKTPEFMEMRVKIAQAAKLRADELKKEKPPNVNEIKKLLTAGRKLATEASRATGPWQEKARKMIADFAGGDVEAAAQQPDPKTFAEARTAGTNALQKMRDADLVVKEISLRLPTISNPQEKAVLQQQIEDARQASTEARADANQFLNVALRLVEKDTDINDLNSLRYFVCFLSFNEEKYYEAIVMGEFIATKYPDSQGARQCAKIAMASYVKLYAESKPDEREFESQQIVKICDYIVKKWPDQPEAEDALQQLITFMIREKKLDKALEFLNKIAADSPNRGIAELKTGQALWAAYLEGQREVRGWDQDPTTAPDADTVGKRKAELEELKKQAKAILIAGVDRMQAVGEISNVVATAVLSLAQIYVDTNEPAKCVEKLEDPKLGVLTLIRAKHPSTQKEGFEVEAYKIALRAFISSLGTAKDTAETIKKAREMMDLLEKSMGNTPEGKLKLIAIYVALARDLQTQLEIADPKSKEALGQGFEVFLGEVSKGATELNVLYWVAETYRGMGESFLTTKNKVPPQAKIYLDKALEIYNKIIALGKTNKNFLTPNMADSIRMQIAKAHRTMNKYKEAVDIFEEILRASPTKLPVQVEAARTYQNWGGLGAKERYKDAILGARPDKSNPDKTKQGKNIIWGWGEIGKMTANNPRYAEQFHEARYNLALSRYHWALAEQDQAIRTDRLKQSRLDIAQTIGLYDNGGPKWEGQYDALLRKIQKSLGETPTGLKSLLPPPVPVNTKEVPKVPLAPKTTPIRSTAPAVVKPAAGKGAPVKAGGTKTTSK
jgi:tetratricopeptide (TPR) repeat protein